MADLLTAQALHDKALGAAQAHAELQDGKLGAEGSRGLDCGFGWVVLKPATHPYVRALKKAGVGDKHWNGGWSLWGSRLHNRSTQSVSVHYAAARAYAQVIEDAQLPGLTVFADSRYD